MNIKDLEGKLVAVLGFGQEGKAVTQYLLKHGIKPVLFDQKEWKDWPKEDQSYIKSLGVNFIFGPGYLEELKGFDVAFRSPGIRLSAVSGQLSANSILTSQTKWFFEHCPAKIIGVTGTKGKGTTCALIYHMLLSNAISYKLKAKSYLTGNIGYTQPLEILDDLKEDDCVVYELSSFQLQDLQQSPNIGVVLMVTSEHLDYHSSIDEYLEAKEAIVKFQTADDFVIINADFPNSMKIGESGKGKKIYFSRKKSVKPGCFVDDGRILFTPPRDLGRGRGEVEPVKVADALELQLRGAHNLENVCAAVAAAHCTGCNFDAIGKALRDFKGLEHRLEFVAEKNGIKFYNDSFSTTPETAIAAIKAFAPTPKVGAPTVNVGDEQLIVILGGSSKKSDFTELGKTVSNSKNIKALILIGEEAQRIGQSIGRFEGQVLEGAKSMPEIFEQIKTVSSGGDVVLLSPACASFDMFKNYKDRGGQFKKEALSFPPPVGGLTVKQ